jgi:hypothetical protein
MLRSLLHQLITRTSTLPEAVEELRSNYPMSDMVPISELTSILQQQYSRFNTVFLFIDALDECEKVDELLNIIRNLSRTVGSWVDVRFMCFSRDEGAIKRTLESSGFSIRPLEYTTVVHDIEVYVRETINNNASGKFQVFNNSPEGLRGDVSNTLVQQSEGMYVKALMYPIYAISRLIRVSIGSAGFSVSLTRSHVVERHEIYETLSTICLQPSRKHMNGCSRECPNRTSPRHNVYSRG